jgi:hypothetical protein
MFLDSTQIEKANKNAFAKFDKTLGAPSASTPSSSNPTDRYDNGVFIFGNSADSFCVEILRGFWNAAYD